MSRIPRSPTFEDSFRKCKSTDCPANELSRSISLLGRQQEIEKALTSDLCKSDEDNDHPRRQSEILEAARERFEKPSSHGSYDRDDE